MGHMRAAGFRNCLAATLLAMPVWLSAQSGGRVAGTVEDSAGAPIPQVHVSIIGTSFQAMSDARGTFRFSGVKPGVYFVRTRRLGYEPLVFRVEVQEADTIALGIQMIPSAAGLTPVRINANAISSRLSLVGFDTRRRFSAAPPAQFVTRADIEKRNPALLSQMLNRMGLRANECVHAVIYLDGMLLSLPPQDEFKPLLTIAKNDSLAKIGSPLPRENPLNNFSPQGIEGMEVYAGPSEIPSQYNPSGRGAGCVILLWTR